MRIRLALALAVSFAGALSASGPGLAATDDTGDSPVLVQLYLPGPVPYVAAAREVASEILADTGIAVRWTECAASGKPSKRTGDCASDAEDLVIALRLETDIEDTYKPGVLGESLPFQDSPVPSRVFLNRVHGVRGSRVGGRVLGHVLAHEIGHVLLESDWHSEHGLMASRWSSHELAEMLYAVLPFSPTEVRMMHRSLSTRFVRHPQSKAALPAEGLN